MTPDINERSTSQGRSVSKEMASRCSMQATPSAVVPIARTRMLSPLDLHSRGYLTLSVKNAMHHIGDRYRGHQVGPSKP
jgi:hypothetical protein